jgi:retron-type reverse transcriptase
MYFVARRIAKEDGEFRVLFDTREPLKSVLKRINLNFLSRVKYPSYLTGGVPGKDYKSSVDQHAGANTVIKEDIKKFFPSVTSAMVFDIWSRFFGFAPEVSDVLTLLTTRDGHLEQGAPTSGYLANLVLWDLESPMIDRLAEHGITRYTRHVDDICMSSTKHLQPAEMSSAVAQVYGMLAAKGLKPNRPKHKTQRGGQSIKILKLVANTKASLPKKERSRIRALVHGFVRRVAEGEDAQNLQTELPRVRGQVYKLKRFHTGKGTRLVTQIDAAASVLKGQ